MGIALMQNALSTKAGRLFTFGTLYIAEGVPLGFWAFNILGFKEQLKTRPTRTYL
jgi:hypothetical protein